MVGLTALTAVMNDNSFVSCRFVTDWLQQPSAGVGTVSRIDVDMQRIEAGRAMIATCLGGRGDFVATKLANKTVVEFCKPAHVTHIHLYSLVFTYTRLAHLPDYH